MRIAAGGETLQDIQDKRYEHVGGGTSEIWTCQRRVTACDFEK